MWATLGYHGPPPLTIARVFSSWTIDPAALLVVVLLGVGYVLALRRSVDERPRIRTVAFFAGLVTILLVKLSFLEVYAGTLFWDRAVQNIVLLMITPLLLALGAPLSLVLSASPPGLAQRLRRWGRSPLARTVTFPLVVTFLLIAPLYGVYFTPLYELSLWHPLVGDLTQLGLVCGGFVYFWTRLQLDPTPRSDHHLVSLWISLTEVIFDGALGLALWLGPLIAHDYYAALARPWGPDMRMDQIIGAGVLWIGGDVAGLPFVGALMARWKRDDERAAAEVDRVLDEQAEEEDTATTGLWWENDPILAERFKRR